MSQLWRCALLLLVAGTLAGCGGGGGDGEAGGKPPTVPAELDDDDPGDEGLDEDFGTYEGSQAYIEAGFTCGTGVDYLAQQYGVKATPEAVARAVSNEKKTKKDREDAYKGCLDTLKAR